MNEKEGSIELNNFSSYQSDGEHYVLENVCTKYCVSVSVYVPNGISLNSFGKRKMLLWAICCVCAIESHLVD